MGGIRNSVIEFLPTLVSLLKLCLGKDSSSLRTHQYGALTDLNVASRMNRHATAIVFPAVPTDTL